MSAANLGVRILLAIHAALVDEDADHETWAAVARAAGMDAPAAGLAVGAALPAAQRLFRELVGPAAARGIRPTHVLRHRLRAWEGEGEASGPLDLLLDHTPLPLSRESELRQDGRPALLWGVGIEPTRPEPAGDETAQQVPAAVKTPEGLIIRPITDDSPRGEQIERGPYAWLLDEVLREHCDAATMHAAVWLRAVLGLAGEESPLRAWACAARVIGIEEMVAAIVAGGSSAKLNVMMVATSPRATSSPVKKQPMEGAQSGIVAPRLMATSAAPVAIHPASMPSHNPAWRDRAMSFVRAQREQWGDARPGTAEYNDRERREIVAMWRATCAETNGGVSQRAFALAMGVDRHTLERFLEVYNDEWLIVNAVCAWISGAGPTAGAGGRADAPDVPHRSPAVSTALVPADPTTTMMPTHGLGASAGLGDHITFLALNIPVTALDQLDAGRSATLAGLMERMKIGGSPR